jgi:uncharacterized Zn-finger protein
VKYCREQKFLTFLKLSIQCIFSITWPWDFKTVKGRTSRFGNFKKLEGDKFNYSPMSCSIQKFQDVSYAFLTIWLGWQSSFIWTKALMSSPNPKRGRTLNKVSAEDVKNFCNNDEVSRVRPTKDYISKSMLSKHMNRRHCCCAILKSYTLILIICT